MKKLKLNENMGQVVVAHGYELDATERYIINIERELSEQSAIITAIQTIGLPALKDYHKWLLDNGVMECSRLNEGFKYTQIILTLGGCL